VSDLLFLVPVSIGCRSLGATRELDYEALLDAESRGRFFLARIRSCFRYERIAKLRAA
jgi:hypothetical protein